MGRVIGYDLTDMSCQVSIGIIGDNGEEVQSVPVTAGTEKYVIPSAAYIKENGDILYGEDAIKAANDGREAITGLLGKAAQCESFEKYGRSYNCRELLSGYIKKTMHMSSVLSPYEEVERAVITLPYLTGEYVKTVDECLAFLAEEEIEYRIIGYPESFFYYAMNQNPELTKNKVALFDYDGNVVRSILLYTRVDTRPHLAMIEHRDFDMPLKDDMCFLEIARSVLDSEIVSAVYLSGEGFEGGWLKRSVSYLCERQRRVFQGRNLYTKGACYAGIDDRDGNPTLDTCRFFDDDKLISNVGIYMIRNGQEIYVPLLEAGTNWYEAKGSSEFYMDTDQEIRVKLESFFTRDVRYSVIRCDSFPSRPAGCTRVRLEASMKDSSSILCKTFDLGFGDIFGPSPDAVETEIFL